MLNLEPFDLVDCLSMVIFVWFRLLDHRSLGLFVGVPDEDLTIHGSTCEDLRIIGMVSETGHAVRDFNGNGWLLLVVIITENVPN